jgi:O-antigen/teichoic acid export membrane protein
MLWWLLFKILGVAMIAFGGFLVVFFPAVTRHQEAGSHRHPQTSFGLSAIVIGLVLIVAGGFVLFSP